MTSRFVLPLADVGAGLTPSAGAQLFFYETGTTTPKDTYSDSAGTIPNANPVVANSVGVFPDIFISGTYKVVLKNIEGVQQWAADPVTEYAKESELTSLYVSKTELAATDGAAILPASGDMSATFQSVADDNDAIRLAAGTYRLEELTGDRLHIKGAGKDLTILELNGTNLETMFDFDDLLLKDLTITDRGRSTMDHTTNAGVYLAKTKKFYAQNVGFKTDRSVMINDGVTSDDQIAWVEDCSISRVNSPVASEEDGMNLFTLPNTRYINFVRNKVFDVVARSVVNGSYHQETAYNYAPAIAICEGNSFEYVRGVNMSNEVKTIFLQGYAAKVDTNTFTDVFGRHVDILSNYNADTPPSARGNIYRSKVVNNTHAWTLARVADVGHLNDEAGVIYCRYGDVEVANNHMDFTNCQLVSNIYSAIAVRHGYHSATIEGNTIIKPIAHGILADISDAIDIDICNVFIKKNTIENALNANRNPIKVANNSNAYSKVFGHIDIQDNECEYASSSKIIEIDQAPFSDVDFICKSMVIENNFNKKFNKWDDVNFKAFPEYLNAPNSTVIMQFDESATNAEGVVNNPVAALDSMSKYKCKKFTVQIEPSVLTDITINGPEAYNPLSNYTIIDANNGTARVKFAALETDQTCISFTLDNNHLLIDDTRVESANAAGTTTSLIFLSGNGQCVIKDGEMQYGEIAVDTRGPDVAMIGTSVNDIDKGGIGAVFYTLNARFSAPKIIAENLTGANVTKLYEFASPAFFAYENLAIGTTAGTKTFTVVV